MLGLGVMLMGGWKLRDIYESLDLSAAAHDVENFLVGFGTGPRFQLVDSLVEDLHAALARLLLLRIGEEAGDDGPALFGPVSVGLVGLGDGDGGRLALQRLQLLGLALLVEFCHLADSSVLHALEAVHQAGLALLLLLLVVEVLLVLEGEGEWRDGGVLGPVEVVVHAPRAVRVVPVQLRLQVLRRGLQARREQFLQVLLCNLLPVVLQGCFRFVLRVAVVGTALQSRDVQLLHFIREFSCVFGERWIQRGFAGFLLPQSVNRLCLFALLWLAVRSAVLRVAYPEQMRTILEFLEGLLPKSKHFGQLPLQFGSFVEFIDGYAFAEFLPHLLIVCFGVVAADMGATERGLKSEDFADVEFVPHGHPGSAFLLGLDGEAAVLVGVGVEHAAHEEGEGLGGEVGGGVLGGQAAAVEEDVLLAGVAVHVDEHHHLLLLALPQHHLLQVVDLGVVVLAGTLPPPVQVEPRRREPEVPAHHPVHVDHRHHLEQETAAQGDCEVAVRGQLFEEALHDEGGDCLAGVDAGGEDDDFLAGEVADVEEGEAAALEGTGESLHLGLVLDECDQRVQFGETVGVGVSEFDAAAVTAFEEEGEPELVVPVVLLGSAQVGDLRASPAPLALPALAVAQTHPVVIQAAAFGEPADHQVRLALHALHREVEPGVPAGRVALLLHRHLEAVHPDQRHLSQTPALEVAAESGAPHLQDFAVDLGDGFGVRVRGGVVEGRRGEDESQFVAFGQVLDARVVLLDRFGR